MAENKLHGYVNWTYNIQLFSLIKDGYNGMQTAPTVTPEGTRLLMASGGIQTNRSPHFKEDFFFNNLKFNTVIGSTAQTQNTNSLDFEFLIIEPMGVTLFNRLIAEAGDIGYDKVVDMIYLLKIEFYGYTDDGKVMKLPIPAKVMPIKINEMTMKVSHRGSEYQCKATPAPHSTTLGQAHGATPIKVEITAGSIAEALLSDIGDDPAPTDGQEVTYEKTHESVKSFTGAINKWYKSQLADKQVTVTDSIAFEVHPEIAKATFVTYETIQKEEKYMPSAGTAKQQGVVTLAEPSTISPQVVMTIAEGTAITEVVGMLIRNSSFIKDQLKDPDLGQGAPAPGPMKWFKIIPRMIYKSFDAGSNRLMRQHIYRIMPYVFYNAKHRSFSMAEAGAPKKEYNYIFTGKNKDIINLDLTFDTSFYSALTTNASTQEVGNAAKSSAKTGSLTTAGPNQAQAALEAAEKSKNAMSKNTSSEVNQHAGSQGANAALSSTTTGDIGRQMQESVSSGDLLDVKLKIVGDPDFIKQDDVTFWNVDPGDEYTKNDSLVMDNGNIFVMVNFKSASDYDMNLGMAVPGQGPYSVGIFSGLYKVMGVDSEFSGGKFTQELHLIRYQLQPSEKGYSLPSSGTSDSSGLAGSSSEGGNSSSANGNGAALGPASAANNVRVESNQVQGIALGTFNKPLQTVPQAVSSSSSFSLTPPDVPSMSGIAKDVGFKPLGPAAASLALPTKLGSSAVDTAVSAANSVNVDTQGGLGNTVTNAGQDPRDQSRVVAQNAGPTEPYLDVPNKPPINVNDLNASIDSLNTKMYTANNNGKVA
jgi:hypothetical protein